MMLKKIATKLISTALGKLSSLCPSLTNSTERKSFATTLLDKEAGYNVETKLHNDKAFVTITTRKCSLSEISTIDSQI